MRNMTEMSLDELSGNLVGLSTATEHEIAVVRKLESGEPKYSLPEAEKFKAIVNNKTSKVAAVVKQGYKLIQHADALNEIIDAFRTFNPEARVRAALNEQSNRAYMTVVFKDVVANDGDKGIELGFNVINSYDATSALRYGGTQRKFTGQFEFFGYRLACMNGMTVRYAINEETMKLKPAVSVGAKVGDTIKYKREFVDRRTLSQQGISGSIRHTGNMELRLDSLRQMFYSLPEISKRLEKTIEDMKELNLTDDEAQDILLGLGYSERSIKHIMEKFMDGNEKNKWVLYNNITDYASHDVKTVSNMEEKLKKAQEMLVIQ